MDRTFLLVNKKKEIFSADQKKSCPILGSSQRIMNSYEEVFQSNVNSAGPWHFCASSFT